MPRPSPIHRDPEEDGDDYGCVEHSAGKGNAEVALLVADAKCGLAGGHFASTEDTVDYIKEGLQRIEMIYDCGCCDTVVKENVFAELHNAIRQAGLPPVDPDSIHGW